MTERKKYKELREAGRMLIERLWGEGEKMSVYVDELPDSCYDCCCNNDDWKCRLTDSELPCKWDVRNDDCPLKVVVHCDKCIHNVGIRENTGFYEEDIVCDYWDCDGLCSWDYCSNGEKKDEED